WATTVSAETLEPVKTPSSVSKPEPAVVIVADPAEDDVHRYQTDAPPELPAMPGSPDSFVAATFEPFALPDAPEIGAALANMSFAGGDGGAAMFQFTEIAPAACPDCGPR